MDFRSHVYDQLWSSIRADSSASLQTTIDSLKPSFEGPVENLHHHTLESLATFDGKLVSLRMMIQDIFQPEFYVAAVTKPGKIESREELENNVILNKYCYSVDNAEEMDCQSNQQIILDRQVYRAIVPKGQTEWVSKMNGGGNVESVILKCYQREGFKLGQIVNVVGILEFERVEKTQGVEDKSELRGVNDYYRIGEVPRLNVISVLDEKQAEQYKLDYTSLLRSKQIDFKKTRQVILDLFKGFSSPRYAQMLLYSLVNRQQMNFYLSGENFEPLLKHLLPYFIRVEVSIPFKKELFPKKGDVIRDTLLQLSEQDTYVLIDFTNIGEGKLQGQEVINLELLKKFAEDGEILYRWEIGETIFTKKTSGIIAKASTIIEPTFNLKSEFINLQKLPTYEDIESIVDTLRAYILQVRGKTDNVTISSDDEKTLIEKDFVQERQETEGKFTPETFNQRLSLCRLEAALLGESEITFAIYQKVKEVTK